MTTQKSRTRFVPLAAHRVSITAEKINIWYVQSARIVNIPVRTSAKGSEGANGATLHTDEAINCTSSHVQKSVLFWRGFVVGRLDLLTWNKVLFSIPKRSEKMTRHTALQSTDVALVDGSGLGDRSAGGVSGHRGGDGNSRDEEGKLGEHCELRREQLKMCLID